jgi:hypothetical protein
MRPSLIDPRRDAKGIRPVSFFVTFRRRQPEPDGRLLDKPFATHDHFIK